MMTAFSRWLHVLSIAVLPALSLGGLTSQDSTYSSRGPAVVHGMAVDSKGNLYVADNWSHRIWRLTSGRWSIFAGPQTDVDNPSLPAGRDGPAGTATFDSPMGLAVDGAGNVYVADRGNYTIRRVTPDGNVTTLAGLAEAKGSVDGVGNAARFLDPDDLATDVRGNVFVIDDGDCSVRRVTPQGAVTTLLRVEPCARPRRGAPRVLSTADMRGLAVDSLGNVYWTDMNEQTIRKFTPAGVLTTLAGNAWSRGQVDGVGSSARFNDPWGIVIDKHDDIFVSDGGNKAIRRVTSRGAVTTLKLSRPLETRPTVLALDPNGDLYVAHVEAILRISTRGTVTSVYESSSR